MIYQMSQKIFRLTISFAGIYNKTMNHPTQKNTYTQTRAHTQSHSYTHTIVVEV